MPELLIILAVVVVLFGGAKLPELGKGLGEGMKSFRKAMKEARSDDDETPAKTS
jgi:sec-independent protein translocase protein TatA